MASSQAALYREMADNGLQLSWSEAELPERVRTKHVHRLHPYLGKFIPQVVEALLARYVPRGGHVLDPFAGSGTTLVQALESGYGATGVDVAAFNALLMRVKTRAYDLDLLRQELLEVHRRALELRARDRYPAGASPYVRAWYAPAAARELLAFRSMAGECSHADVVRIVLARAARSARRTTHFDLESPRAPQLSEYWCHKHRRICRPVGRAAPFLSRYTLDTLARIEEFARLRTAGTEAQVVHGDSSEIDLRGPFEAVLTSPPYPGLIDYHEQHRYAYELLGLPERRGDELGSPVRGSGVVALNAYVAGIVAVLDNCLRALRPGAPVIIVVNDRRNLYPEILERGGLTLVDRFERHVNRRTGRRAGEYFESVLVAVRER